MHSGSQNTTTVDMMDLVHENVTNATLVVAPPVGVGGGDLLTMAQYYDALKVALSLGIAICIGGTVGNILNIRTFLRMGLDDCMTIVFFNLSIADLMVLLGHLLSAIPTVLFIIQVELGLFFTIKPQDVATLVVVVSKTFSFATKMLTTFLALQRLLCVAIPLHFKGVFTRSRTFIITGIIWVYCIMCGTLLLFQFSFMKVPGGVNGTSTHYVMYRNLSPLVLWFMTIIISMLNGAIINAASLIIVFTCVVTVQYVLMRSVKFRKENLKPASGGGDEAPSKQLDKKNKIDKSVEVKDNLSGAKERQAIVQVLIVSIIFLVTSIPHIVNILIDLVIPNKFATYGEYHYAYGTFYLFRLTFEQVNSAVNIFIYYKYNTKYRELCFKKKI